MFQSINYQNTMLLLLQSSSMEQQKQSQTSSVYDISNKKLLKPSHKKVSNFEGKLDINKYNQENKLNIFACQLVKNQIKLLIEASIRIARFNKRDLDVEDVVEGIKYIRMGEIFEDMQLQGQGDEVNLNFKRGEIKKATKQIKGTWIFLDFIVPNTNIKQSMKIWQYQTDDSNNCNQIVSKVNIYQNPNFLSQQDIIALNLLLNCYQQSSDISPNICVVKYLPFILNTLIKSPIDKSILFLSQIFNTQKILQSTQYYIHQIMILLINYQGSLSWQCGILLSKIIKYWQYKYPILHNSIHYLDKNKHSNLIKQIVYCIYFHLPLDLKHSCSMQLQSEFEMSYLYKQYWIILNKNGIEYTDDEIVGIAPKQYLQAFL